MLKRWKTISSALFLEAVLIGCSTPPTPPSFSDANARGEQLLWPGTGSSALDEFLRTNRPANARSVKLSTNALVTLPEGALTPAQASLPVEAPAPVPLTNVAASKPWVPWHAWSEARGWGKPERRRQTSALSYELKGSPGVLEVTPGLRTALWNGLLLELGFAPRLTDGQPHLHRLDLAKTFDPLTLRLPVMDRPDRVIVIDPGHGGDNLGARCAVSSRYEKEFALDWARRLERLLVERGWRVHLTRTADVEISLSNRVVFAEQVNAHAFVSLHFNSSDQPQGQSAHGGIETYCLTPAGMPSTLTRRFSDELDVTYPNNAFDAENYSLATRLHRALVETTRRRDRGVRRARFMGVLRGQNRPAVLLEAGYLTHPEEARLIGTAEYRQKLALAVARALSP